MSYLDLPAGTGPSGSYLDGDDWTVTHGTRSRDNFINHEARIVTLEGAPASASGLKLLETHTVANGASALFTTRNVTGQSGATIQADFDKYLLDVLGVFPANNGVALRIQMSTDGGATYDATSGHYSWASFAMAFNATGSNGSTSDTGVSLLNDMANAAKLSQQASFILSNLRSTSLYKLITGSGNQTDQSRTTNSLAMAMAGKFLVDATAVNAFKLFAATGNMTGVFRLYGYATS